MAKAGTAGIIVLLLVACSPALACMWDVDTLSQERTRFPSALELITGKFLRHSREFYAWRIKDRLNKLKTEPDNLAYFDDLAVAYEKTGDHQKAIETMLAKDKRRPGLYETEANLGTFYIHAGQYQKGLEHIDRALRINPNAHFGREKYQALVVKFLLEHQTNGHIELPLNGLGQYLSADGGRQDAVKGVLGMMRFGDFESPVLLEALAGLLTLPGNTLDEPAYTLAARAYLQASYHASDKPASDAYHRKAVQILEGANKEHAEYENPIIITAAEFESTFRRELDEGHSWFAGLRSQEVSWIKKGLDADLEFARVYAFNPRITTQTNQSGPDPSWSPSPELLVTSMWTMLGLAALGMLLLILGSDRLIKRYRRKVATAGGASEVASG